MRRRDVNKHTWSADQLTGVEGREKGGVGAPIMGVDGRRTGEEDEEKDGREIMKDEEKNIWVSRRITIRADCRPARTPASYSSLLHHYFPGSPSLVRGKQ